MASHDHRSIEQKWRQSLQGNRIFVVDSLGALLTALLTAGLSRWAAAVGLPADLLLRLAAGAFAMAVYGAACATLRPAHWRPWLALLAGANVAYCILAAALLLLHTPTALGWAWFCTEWLIVSVLVWVEVRLVRA